MIDLDKQKEVFDYFRTADTDSAEACLEELGDDEFSLNEIRMMRVKFMSELGN